MKSSFILILLMSLYSVLYADATQAEAVDSAQPARLQPLFKYSSSATLPIIEYTLQHDMLADADPQPLLRIYGNGRVHVHYPDYMKKAGDYEMFMDRNELNALIRDLSGDGMLEFDQQQMRSEREQLVVQQRVQTGTLYEVSDESHTIITLRLDEYQKIPGGRKSINVNKRFSWPNLPQDARRFPQAKDINNANRAAQRLDSVMHRPELVKLKQ